MPGGARRRFLVTLAVAAAAGATVNRPCAAEGTADEPTAAEQYMLEILNRTRANPAAEALSFKIDLNEGLPAGTLTPEAREPLAMNLDLLRAARLHNQDLLAHFTQLPPDHVGSDGKDPTGRATDQGVDFIGGVAENNSFMTQGATAVTSASVNALHLLLFKDFTQKFEVVGRGHRKTMLNGVRDEAGVAVAGGTFGGKIAAICTQDFIETSRLHITGVAYADVVARDSFYTPGEGLWGARIVATRRSDNATFETLTYRSGGYSLVVGPGTYDVSAEGGGLPQPQVANSVVVTDANVKQDFVTRAPVAAPTPPRFVLAKSTAKLAKTGGWTLTVPASAFSIRSFTFATGEPEQVFVEVDGLPFFRPQDRASAVVKQKLDPVGKVVKLTVKDPAGNLFTLDLKKGTFLLTLKSAPGFDPTDGSVQIVVHAAGRTASVTSAAQAVGTAGKKMTLLPATGTVN